MTYLAPILYAYILWLLFIVVMALQARWKKLPLTVKIIASPAVLIAVVMDALFNYTFACVLFLKLPAKGEYMFSQRIGNYKKRIDWRAPLAHWICANLLDPFDVDGSHCGG